MSVFPYKQYILNNSKGKWRTLQPQNHVRDGLKGVVKTSFKTREKLEKVKNRMKKNAYLLGGPNSAKFCKGKNWQYNV